MYGVPSNLDLMPFQGASLDQIALGQYIIHFHFAAEHSPVIGVEGKWELADSAGRILDHQMEPGEREVYRLHVLLGRTVTAGEVHAPDSFTLHFEGGYTLRIYDDSRQYESFSIQPGNVYV